MRYHEVMTEKAKFRASVLMYHGTTNRYLSSVLKQGIVPDPRRKTWADDPDVSSVQHNRTSLFGSYWTSNLMTAQSSGFRSCQKFGGEPLIVMAMIAEGSAWADEDSLNLERVWGMMMHDLGVIPDAYRVPAYIYYARSHSENPEYREYENNKLDQERAQLLSKFAQHLHQWAKASSQQPIDQALANATFEAYLVRQLAYNTGPGYYSPLNDIAPEDRPQLPSKPEAEQRLHAIRDKLTRRYRASVYKRDDSFMHTLRMPMPIGYAGSNKIICVVEEARRMYNEPKRPVKLWYGQLPNDYLAQYRERVGGFPGLIDGRTEAELMPADADD